MEHIQDSFLDLFEQKSFAHFATVMPDGTPQVTPVWVDYDETDDRVLVNTMQGRQKERNVQRQSKVGLSIIDPDDPYRYVSVRGEVETVTQEGAVDHINELAHRYMGQEYPNLEDESGPRVVMRIRPDRVVTSG
ncbi:MAG: PPOX class probable F420-dependent enzyme [Halobacteriales archaeon]|jgi:PPOX class probable F420-dependent enzyme